MGFHEGIEAEHIYPVAFDALHERFGHAGNDGPSSNVQPHQLSGLAAGGGNEQPALDILVGDAVVKLGCPHAAAKFVAVILKRDEETRLR